MPDLRVDAEEFGQFADSVRGVEQDVRRALGKALREVAKPTGKDVVRIGSVGMPSRGGLRSRLAGAKVGVLASLGGSSPKVTLKLGDKGSADLTSLDRGELRHPVFARSGRPKVWTRQSVKAGTYSKAFEGMAPRLRDELYTAAQEVLDDIARKA